MNDFVKYCMPPLPLSFDRVNEGLPAVSDCPLFNIPIEILGLILQNVTEESLPRLSLVSKNCLQLTRSRQFATVHLQYSDTSRKLVTKLLAEGSERAWNGGRTVLPSIGACVQQLFVDSGREKENNIYDHRTVYSHKLTTLDEVDETYFVADDSGYYDDYIFAVQELVSNHKILPHLSLLSWTEMVLISPSVLRGLACSSIQHLRLSDVSVEENLTVELPIVLQSRNWPLRTLAVEFYRTGQGMMERIASQLFTNILHLCSATLESLTWKTGPPLGFLEDRYRSDADISDIPYFPRLRYLRYSSFNVRDPPYLRALVSDNLQALQLETNSSSFIAQFFRARGSIPSLNTLVWYTYYPEEVHLLDFLHENTHISKLDLPMPQQDIFLEMQLLPLLASSFTRLTSLSLCWGDTHVSPSALEVISTMHSLQQIHLYVWLDEGSIHDWLDRHRSMQISLGKLTRLRKLAFGGCFCDYTTPSVSSASESAEEDIDPAEWAEDVDSVGRAEEIDPEEWEEDVDPAKLDEDTNSTEQDDDDSEDLHQLQILSMANEYVAILPELEWLYIGGLQMDVVSSSNSEHRAARVLSRAGRTPYHTATERWTLIRELFGWERDL
ncbi:hypothetical protein MMC27_003571 [Xylographa pallens]|nr:hypothetical protein [Xylographa pallens]